MVVQVDVDTRKAIAKFSAGGIPESVRTNLRRVIPDLTRQLGAAVQRNLEQGTKSQTHLVVKKELVEDPHRIYGRVRTLWTGAPSKAMVPQWLEAGTKPHVIEAKNAAVLAFFWPKINAMFFGPRVNHPGTKAIWYSRNALNEMQAEIRARLAAAVKTGAREAA